MLRLHVFDTQNWIIILDSFGGKQSVGWDAYQINRCVGCFVISASKSYSKLRWECLKIWLPETSLISAINKKSGTRILRQSHKAMEHHHYKQVNHRTTWAPFHGYVSWRANSCSKHWTNTSGCNIALQKNDQQKTATPLVKSTHMLPFGHVCTDIIVYKYMYI